MSDYYKWIGSEDHDYFIYKALQFTNYNSETFMECVKSTFESYKKIVIDFKCIIVDQSEGGNKARFFLTTDGNPYEVLNFYDGVNFEVVNLKTNKKVNPNNKNYRLAQSFSGIINFAFSKQMGSDPYSVYRPIRSGESVAFLAVIFKDDEWGSENNYNLIKFTIKKLIHDYFHDVSISSGDTYLY